MNRTLKVARIGIGISSAAVLISVIAMIISGFRWTEVTMFCGMIAVLCANIAIYSAEKKKDDSSKK